MLTSDGRREDRRFRHRPDREQQHDPGRHGAGHPGLHVARAVHGPGRRSRAPTSIPPGVLLYQLLTGERPFEGGMTAIMHKALNTEPPRPSQLSVTAPAAFDAVVAQGDGEAAGGSLPHRRRVRRGASARRCGAPAVAEREADGEATMVGRSGARPALPACQNWPAAEERAGRREVRSSCRCWPGAAVAALWWRGGRLVPAAPRPRRLAEAAPAARCNPRQPRCTGTGNRCPPAAPSPEPQVQPACSS